MHPTDTLDTHPAQHVQKATHLCRLTSSLPIIGSKYSYSYYEGDLRIRKQVFFMNQEHT